MPLQHPTAIQDHASALAQARAQLQAGDAAAALKTLDDARRASPQSPEILFMMANIMNNMGQSEGAVLLYRQLLGLRPRDPGILNNLAGALHELGRLDEADTYIREALALRADMPDLWVTQATIDDVRGRRAEAETSLRRALAARGDHPVALANLAALLSARGAYDEAERMRGAARAQLGDRPRLLVAQANDFFRAGRLGAAWPLYEARFAAAPGEPAMVAARGFAQPRWRGEKTGGALLVWAEQGIGEEIMYGALLPEAAGRCARLVAECDARLVEIFARSFPGVQCIARRSPADPPDPRCAAGDIAAQIPFASLGGIFRNGEKDFPRHEGYLKADAPRAAALRADYAAQAGEGKTLVGISWRSKPYKYSDPKSSDLQDWEALLRAPGIVCVSLQYGDCKAELEAARAAGATVLHDDAIDPLRDMDAFMAQAAAMDRIVTVSNATAHVAGALGKTADVLVPHGGAAPPHWQAERGDSPWYPALTLWRQDAPGAWRGLVERIAENMAR